LRAIEKQIDERLLVEAAQRDPSGFTELYENNFNRVYAYVARRVRSREEAEDVTSEVFHQALANIAHFEWRGAPFVAWLLRIAAHAIASRWRDGPTELEIPSNTSEEPGVDDRIEQRTILNQLVESLPPDQRHVITRRFAEGASASEIAKEMGRSEGAVKQLQFRAMQSLRTQIEEIMTNPLLLDQLDAVIDMLAADPNAVPLNAHEDIRDLIVVARELHVLPRPEFRARLKADLDAQARAMARPSLRLIPAKRAERMETPLPSLFGNFGSYPVHRANFAVSFLLHAAVLALLITSGLWIGHREQPQQQAVSLLSEPGSYVLPAGTSRSAGGGGGGDHDKLQASKGTLPRSAREQLVPPVVVIRNSDPKLSVEAAVVAPPHLTPQQLGQNGDPLSALLTPPSNGTGSAGGIGGGGGGGVGAGYGPGVGPGYGGGIGGGIYHVGGGVSAPRAIFRPVPDYSDEARKSKHQGTVVVEAVIGADGRTRDLHVQRSLGMGLDEKALEAVRKWRFEPAMKDGHAVNVLVSIEVNFRLY